MEQKIFLIVRLAEEIISSQNSEKANEKLAYFKQWLSYFQHERLIHLIVTISFSFLAVFCTFIVYVEFNVIIGILTLSFLIMSIVYIRHYFILENKTQHLYELIDELQILSSNETKNQI